MRWDVIKQAWQLARESFPKVERLYVSFPDRFRNSGECDVLDLEKPGDPIGKIGYRFGCHDQDPVAFLSLDDLSKEVKLPCQAALELKTETAPLNKTSSIWAEDIMGKYGDLPILGEQLAYLCLGHEEGPLYRSQQGSINEAALSDWIKKAGFPPKVLPHVTEKLAKLGVRTILDESGFNLKRAKSKKSKRKFADFAKVRIIDPMLLSEGRGGQIVGHEDGKDDEHWYAVIVDGSSKPVRMHEKQLAENTVGKIDGVSTMNLPPASGQGMEVQP